MICKVCNKNKDISEFYKCGNGKSNESECKICRNIKRRNTRKVRKENNLCIYCGNKTNKNNISSCENCRDSKNKYYKIYKIKIGENTYQRKIKLEVFNAYGGAKCVCCGDEHIEFLTIDHINNDGAKHRKKIFRKSMYYWLRKNNYPNGFQVLCMNCNFSKGKFGYCPHEQSK